MLATQIHNFFIPSIKACHRPKAFTHKWLKFYSLALLSHIVLSVGFYSGPTFVTESPESMARNIVNLTNEERVKNELSEVTESPLLKDAAEDKLADMFANNYWDHTSPQNKKPWDFILENNYSYVYAGENLAKGYIDSASTVQAWMNSPTHKDNILSARYSEIGIAVGTGKINGRPTTIIVQMFGTPKSSAIAAAPTEEAVVLGVKENTKVTFGSIYASIPSRAPYFVIWFIIFCLIIFDGGMLRRCGLHTSKKHLFEFRSALIINFFALIFLTANFVAVA